MSDHDHAPRTQEHRLESHLASTAYSRSLPVGPLTPHECRGCAASLVERGHISRTRHGLSGVIAIRASGLAAPSQYRFGPCILRTRRGRASRSFAVPRLWTCCRVLPSGDRAIANRNCRGTGLQTRNTQSGITRSLHTGIL